MSHPEVPEVPGGQGAEASASRSDLKLYAQAIRQRWPIPDAMRERVLQSLTAIVSEALIDPESADRRAVAAAAKAIIDADKINMEQEKRDQAIPDRHVVEHRYADMTDEQIIARAKSLLIGADPSGSADPA